MRWRQLAVCLAWAAAASLPLSWVMGCGAGAVNVAETHVGKEELYRTGNFNYDEFFEDVHVLQGSAKNAAADEKAARAPLGQALGVGETSLDRLLDVLKEKADELAQSKSRVHLVFEGLDEQAKPLAGKQIGVTAAAAKGKAVPKEATELAAALEQTARGEGQVWEKYAPAPDKGRRLAEKADALSASIGVEFASTSKEKREEVEREVKAAKKVVEQISEQCDRVVGSATRLLKQSGEILVAAANAEVKPPTPKGKPGKPTTKPREESKGEGPQKPAPAKPATAKPATEKPAVEKPAV
ncbi:MAG TPA: hypothetical protein VJT73_03270, partial [Polyangiaceae bacterium]|nr:hypothetical protein [Polyangiaceae bacterium]